MGPGGIASIIAASALLIIAFAIAYSVIRLGNLIKEAQKTVRSVNKITATAEALTDKVTLAVNSITKADSPVMKIVGTIAGLANSKIRRSSKDHE